jgi:hypothetical protein
MAGRRTLDGQGSPRSPEGDGHRYQSSVVVHQRGESSLDDGHGRSGTVGTERPATS